MPKNGAISTILEQERRLGLWRERPFGFPVWSTERLAYYRLLKDGTTSPVGGARVRPKNDLSDALSASRDLFKWTKRLSAERDIWVLSSSMYRRRAADGSNPCIFTADLERQLGPRLLFLELNDGEVPIAPSQEPKTPNNVVFIESVRHSLRVGARFAHRFLPQTLAGESLKLLTLLPPERQRAALVDSLAGRSLYEISLQLMSLKRPKVVFVLCAYGRHVPIQLAARKLGIPIIELQHGMIHESHPGYILPTLDADLERSLPFPDHLVVFGRHFGELLDRESPRWRGRWSVGGHPTLKAPRNAEATTSKAPSGTRPHLVFFSQFEHAVQQQIDQVAADLCARTATQYRITIKPHPREINAEQIYGRAIAAGAQLLSSDHNSYRLLEEIDVAVTVYSTLAVETLAYPCRSIVLQSPDWSEAIHSLLAEHYLERADDAEQLAELLKIAPAIRDRSEIARRLFGIGEPTLDFASLIERQITALE